MDILYFGCDNFGMASLERLSDRYRISGIVTAPDKPIGRGMKLCSNLVKKWAIEKNIRVFQPENLDKEFFEFLETLKVDILLLISYGKKLPRKIIEMPLIASINVHPSLLPKYRGAAPIEWTLINGERKTGVTIIKMSPEIDKGEVLACKEIKIEDDEDIFSLKEKLSYLSSEMVIDVIEDIKLKGINSSPQVGTPTYARKLLRKDGLLNWELSSTDINNLIRGVKEWPGAYTFISTPKGEKCLKIFSAENVPNPTCKGRPGEIVSLDNFIEVACGKGNLRIKEVQVEGKKKNQAYEFICGYRLELGTFFFSREDSSCDKI